MTSRPDPIALDLYQSLLTQRSDEVEMLERIVGHSDRPLPATVEAQASAMLLTARSGQHVAVKLIKAWRDDVATRAAIEAADRVRITDRFRR